MEIFLGTYHWVRSARGQITITDPDEMEHAFDLTQICNGGQARYGGKCPAADIKDACIGSEKDDVVHATNWTPLVWKLLSWMTIARHSRRMGPTEGLLSMRGPRSQG